MKSLIKSSLIFILCSTLPVISYADQSEYCPEGKNISSSQGPRQIRIDGYNFQNKLFTVTYNIGIPPNDAPSIWYDNFRFSQSSYDKNTRSLSCTYTATHHIYGEPSSETWVTITNNARS